MKDTVLITGATGFLGEYLVKRLAGRYRVLALGRNREKAGSWRNRARYFALEILRIKNLAPVILKVSVM